MVGCRRKLDLEAVPVEAKIHVIKKSDLESVIGSWDQNSKVKRKLNRWQIPILKTRIHNFIFEK
jgi:transcription antitermination factor NusA-like protein